MQALNKYFRNFNSYKECCSLRICKHYEHVKNRQEIVISMVYVIKETKEFVFYPCVEKKN